MPRGPRLDAPGLVHHVVCRGIERREIFVDDVDRERFLSRLAQLAGGENNQVYAFALMPNHVHILLRTLAMPLATLMRRLLTGYAVYFNRRHRRSGHLFQNRYKSFIVEEDPYLVELIRYIHLNPLRAGIVADLTALSCWPFTGHAALMGSVDRTCLEVEQTLLCFDGRTSAARRKLTAFMQDGLLMGRRSDLSGGGLRRSLVANRRLQGVSEPHAYDERILGSGAFVEAILNRLTQQATQKNKASLDELLSALAAHYHLTDAELRSGSKRPAVAKARAAAIWLGVKQLAIPAKELADTLGVGPTTVYSALAARKGEQESGEISLS